MQQLPLDTAQLLAALHQQNQLLMQQNELLMQRHYQPRIKYQKKESSPLRQKLHDEFQTFFNQKWGL